MKARKMPFDTLRFANRMKAAGMSSKLAEEQAEAIAEALYDGLEAKLDNLVTKDLFEAKIANLVTKAEFNEFKLEFKLDLERVEKKLGRLMVGCFGLVSVAVGLIQHFHI